MTHRRQPGDRELKAILDLLLTAPRDNRAEVLGLSNALRNIFGSTIEPDLLDAALRRRRAIIGSPGFIEFVRFRSFFPGGSMTGHDRIRLAAALRRYQEALS